MAPGPRRPQSSGSDRKLPATSQIRASSDDRSSRSSSADTRENLRERHYRPTSSVLTSHCATGTRIDPGTATEPRRHNGAPSDGQQTRTRPQWHHPTPCQRRRCRITTVTMATAMCNPSATRNRRPRSATRGGPTAAGITAITTVQCTPTARAWSRCSQRRATGREDITVGARATTATGPRRRRRTP